MDGLIGLVTSTSNPYGKMNFSIGTSRSRTIMVENILCLVYLHMGNLKFPTTQFIIHTYFHMLKLVHLTQILLHNSLLVVALYVVSHHFPLWLLQTITLITHSLVPHHHRSKFLNPTWIIFNKVLPHKGRFMLSKMHPTVLMCKTLPFQLPIMGEILIQQTKIRFPIILPSKVIIPNHRKNYPCSLYGVYRHCTHHCPLLLMVSFMLEEKTKHDFSNAS
jgi:hypothetical protein